MEIIDLSQRLSPDMLVYPGDDGLTMTPSAGLPQTTYLETGSHIGTHIDAPCHMLAGGSAIDGYPLSHFIGRAYCTSPEIVNERVAAPTRQVPDDTEILVIRTGWQRRTADGKSFLLDFPAFSDELADYILERGFRLVACDIPSVDREPDFPVHKRLLSRDILLAEGLVCPKELAGQSFTFAAFPLNMACDSSPVRAVAIFA